MSGPIVVLFVFLVVSSFFSYVRTTVYTISGERIVASLRSQLFQALLSQEIGFFDVTRTGELINRLSADCVRFLPPCLVTFLSFRRRLSRER